MIHGPFSLDERLSADSLLIAESDLLQIRWMNDSRFKWFLAVPKVAQVCEIFDLSEAKQTQLWHEVSVLACRLKRRFSADKINLAAIGNQVEQLHVHVVVRFKTDSMWPKPIWGSQPLPYGASVISRELQSYRDLLTQPFTPVPDC